jgi:hypothetical protein
VAMLGSRKAAERAAGVDTSACILNTMGDSNRKLCELQTAVVEAGGIPLFVRMLESRGHDGRVHSQAAYVVQELALYSMKIMRWQVLFRLSLRCCLRHLRRFLVCKGMLRAHCGTWV